MLEEVRRSEQPNVAGEGRRTVQERAVERRRRMRGGGTKGRGHNGVTGRGGVDLQERLAADPPPFIVIVVVEVLRLRVARRLRVQPGAEHERIVREGELRPKPHA